MCWGLVSELFGEASSVFLVSHLLGCILFKHVWVFHGFGSHTKWLGVQDVPAPYLGLSVGIRGRQRLHRSLYKSWG